jgi:Flp pilus assembly protein CpaB
MKKILPIIIALLLAAVASIGIVSAAKTLTAQGANKPIVIATRDIKKGDKLASQDMIQDSIRYPQNTSEEAGTWKFVMQDFVTPDNMGSFVGQVTTQEIKAGQPIISSMLKMERQQRNLVDWKAKIPKSKRAISIPIQSRQAVAGNIAVGDFVDILVTLPSPLTKPDDGKQMMNVPVPMSGGKTQTMQVPVNTNQGKPTTYFLMQGVEILAIGNTTVREEEVYNPEDPFAEFTQDTDMGDGITVALSPEQTLLFAYAISADEAIFVITLRNPEAKDDMSDEDVIPPGSFDELLKKVGALPEI